MRSWPAFAKPPSLTCDPRHAAAAARYAALKHQLAPLLATNRAAYVAGKADLIAELLALARR